MPSCGGIELFVIPFIVYIRTNISVVLSDPVISFKVIREEVNARFILGHFICIIDIANEIGIRVKAIIIVIIRRCNRRR
ncbi:MAG: hypothetical protein Q9180_006612 [Flavoplaca navasiana]